MKSCIRARGTHVIARGRTGLVRRNFFFFYYFRKWLKTVLAPNKTKTLNWVQGYNGHLPYFSNFLFVVCQGVRRTRQADSRLTPCSGGAWGLLWWTEIVYRSTERCAAAWSSSRGGACNHQMSVDATEAGWSRRPRFSLSCTSMCRRVPHIFGLCTSVPRLLILFLVLISVI